MIIKKIEVVKKALTMTGVLKPIIFDVPYEHFGIDVQYCPSCNDGRSCLSWANNKYFCRKCGYERMDQQ